MRQICTGIHTAANRKEKQAIEAQLAIDGFVLRAEAEVLILNGPNALSHNDVANREPRYHSFRDAPDPIVQLTRSPYAVSGAAFRYLFPPHSVTVIRMQAR